MSRLPSYNPLHLNLPIGDLASAGKMFSGFTGDPRADMARLGDAYGETYGAALNMNSALAQDTQRTIEQRMADATNQNAAITGAYDKLGTDVQGTIRGIEASRATDINDTFARDQSDMMQGLISRGLGNTTVQESMTRGNISDRDRARTRLANEIAGLSAGYQSSIGLAGISDMRRGQEQVAGMGREFTDFLQSIQAPYPDAGMFGQIAQQFGAADQANQDRNLLMQQLQAQQRAASQQAGGMTMASPTTGGGFMGGSGRGLEGPRANYGGGVTYGGGAPGGGISMVNPRNTGIGYAAPPSLIGAGGGMEGTGGYSGYGGFDQTGGGFGGAVSAGGLMGVGGQSVADFAGPAAGPSVGGYGFSGGFGGGTGSGLNGNDFGDVLGGMFGY